MEEQVDLILTELFINPYVLPAEQGTSLQLLEYGQQQVALEQRDATWE